MPLAAKYMSMVLRWVRPSFAALAPRIDAEGTIYIQFSRDGTETGRFR
jgi:hypothetical protein